MIGRYRHGFAAVSLCVVSMILPCLSAEEVAPAPPAPPPKPVRFAGGASLLYANWKSGWPVNPNDYLRYDFDKTIFTTLEGDICWRDVGISAGVNVNVDDNRIGEIRDWMAYFGYEQTYLRVSAGRLSGSAYWDGYRGVGQVAEVDFDSPYANIDLLYWFRRFTHGEPGYIGIGYTTFALPTEIRTWRTFDRGDSTEAQWSVFDADFKMELYNIVVGYDSFASSMLYLDSDKDFQRGKDWSLFFVTQDRFGIGRNHISDTALAAARLFHPGLTPVGRSQVYVQLEIDISIGIKKTLSFRNARMAAGLGYSASLIAGDSLPNLNGADSDELFMQPQNYLFRQGPILRLYARW